MVDVWCSSCGQWPSESGRTLCAACVEGTTPTPAPAATPKAGKPEDDGSALALGCLVLVMGLGGAFGYFIRGFM